MDQIRNFRDFLMIYNKISDTCFTSCANSFMTREVEPDEAACVESCAKKYILTNHRMMKVFIEAQAQIVQRRIEEMNAAQQTEAANNSAPNELASNNNSLTSVETKT
ncbi:mitochondrial import inner membrane translocase subunit Tim10 B-like [Trichogramma pretiosum]|uniref:mitochondrial import inner membrane translocase subunit Tim10 B-like n=1 Tax=Trichogramma pretiosum TaxID=7493 RepID=UPI0006C95874|nr:mitochondrial import inner membrane translocase subunit Tim10 B-like [Trichogramma pretiosum]